MKITSQKNRCSGLLIKNGNNILSLNDWKQLAPPKRDYQWQDNFSAKETARAWVAASPLLPQEIETLLELHSAFGRPELWHAEPEARIRFDAFPGEPRNTDVLVWAKDHHGDYIIAVEAKAQEPFGATVGGQRKAAVERKRQNPRSNGEGRIRQLEAALIGNRESDSTSVDSLRYQLFTATAGALRAAIDYNCPRAILVIQEFVPVVKNMARLAANAADLDAFVARVTHGVITKVVYDRLEGPIRVPEGFLFPAVPDLYIGKVKRDIT
jgi:hypothetical protein